MDNPAFIPDGEESQPRKGAQPAYQDGGEKVNQMENGAVKDISISVGQKVEKAVPDVQLKQSIGLASAIGIIISNVIGSGIFISPQGVLRGSGSVGLSLVIWALCGILSLFGALTYAELGTLINDSGGTYIYLLEGFSPDRMKKKREWKAIPAFLYNWQNSLFAKPAAMAIIALSCGEYLVRLSNVKIYSWTVQEEESSKLAVKLIAAGVLCIVAAVNCYSVKLSMVLQNISAFLKLLAVSTVIICGVWKCTENPSSQALASGFRGTNFRYGDIASAFYSGLWAYNGWQNLNYVTQEMKHSVRDLPRAIIPASLLVVLCYLLVNVSYLLVLTKAELLHSETVAVGFGYRVAGQMGEIMMIVFVAITTFGSATSGCFTAGRLCYVAAREGHMMSVFSYIHKDFLTPTSAIMLNLLLGLVMIIPSDIRSLISLSGFTTWLFIGATQVSLLVMRRTREDHARAVKVNSSIPVIVFLFSIFLVLTPILDRPTLGYFYVLAFLLLGLLVYVVFVHFRLVIPGTGYFTLIVQKVLHVVPPSDCHFDS